MDDNQKKNIEFYDQKYQFLDAEVNGILKRLNKLDVFLADATSTDTSWVGLYHGDFQNKIVGKKILELGCGDCANAAIMAALGADVYANDISSKSGEIIAKVNELYKFTHPIVFIEGDFLTADFKEKDFDFVVGKAFLHHLTHDVERKFFSKICELLTPTGESRFFEPAVNSIILDEVRWHIPVPGRPSKFSKNAFQIWKANDPHPERDNSSTHFKKLGLKYFNDVKIINLGALERFHRLLPAYFNSRSFRKKAFVWERKLPCSFNRILARSQVIIYTHKKSNKI
ncbi:class I SAM-dependent methyltransferase [Gillisia sp. Hel_I_29]|uniref:class I SAM-dependent methyltransferase n=1 Tax=Gillisia sp. Hel_I_29 TaxID=1249975 RepID=UPI00054F12A8|nr:class I SAM-dependent methyltransferase [Gillisia sp. Hel_I_29]